MTTTPNISRENNSYDECQWFKRRVEGPDGDLWLQARSTYLVSKNYSKTLPWFKVACSEPLRDRTRGFHVTSNHQENNNFGSNCAQVEIGGGAASGHKFNVNQPIRKLIDLIITRWDPSHLNGKCSKEKLHDSLIPDRLRNLDDVISYFKQKNPDNITDNELNRFYSCLITLHYHEVWASIARDYSNSEIPEDNRRFNIIVDSIKSEVRGCGKKDAAVIIGTVDVVSNDSFTHLNKTLGLFDVIMIKINNKQYFGAVIHVQSIDVKNINDNVKQQSVRIKATQSIKIELLIVVGIYVSKECAEAVNRQQQKERSEKLELQKLSNIISPVRMISALDTLQSWTYQRSIIMPKSEDPYFHLPSDFDTPNTVERNGVNDNQLQAIDISARMHEDPQDRLHLILGPPGTGKTRTIASIVSNLISNHLFEGRKILVCAPSNSACDVLSCRILHSLSQKQRDEHTLIRIGSQPPSDDLLSSNFLSFLVLEEIFSILQADRNTKTVKLSKLQEKILNKAKVIVSTLNNCASSRLSPLVGKVDFVIIDEASQSLMADCFIPNRFKCAKVILVGDPMQLPPTVLSEAGRDYGLNRSLYEHIHQTLKDYHRITTLNVQYRMHSTICSFPNDFFYDNTLKTDSSVDEATRNMNLCHIYYYNTAFRETKEYDRRNQNDDCIKNGGRIKNDGEAEFVKQLYDNIYTSMPSSNQRSTSTTNRPFTIVLTNNSGLM
ncbi:unnamed protein product [Rotaria magnacalcarata]|uniref:Uncharacterized protein n=2 Tax=Rotaria magnacalcarata TaxID=392030 RepID=A0A8S2N821_9BILA|nr:unnamed protein product [Rotaria magnacalcarata]